MYNVFVLTSRSAAKRDRCDHNGESDNFSCPTVNLHRRSCPHFRRGAYMILDANFGLLVTSLDGCRSRSSSDQTGQVAVVGSICVGVFYAHYNKPPVRHKNESEKL